MSQDNVKDFPVKPDEIKASVERMRRYLPDLLENIAMTAQLKRKYYLSLVAEGFSEAQALELCKGSLV